MPDVEMKPTEDKLFDKETEEDRKPSPPSPFIEIKNNVALLGRAVSTLEPRFTHRVYQRGSDSIEGNSKRPGQGFFRAAGCGRGISVAAAAAIYLRGNDSIAATAAAMTQIRSQDVFIAVNVAAAATI